MDERPTLFEIEIDLARVFSFRSYNAPAVGETVNWESRFRVKVVARDWVVDQPAGLPRDVRCILVCKKIEWPKPETRRPRTPGEKQP